MLEIVEKAWGSETVLVNTDLYCGKYLDVRKGASSSLHRHHRKDETFHLEWGRVALELIGPNGRSEAVVLQPGMSRRVPPGTWHRFEGLEWSRIVEISTHHEDHDVERREPSRAAPPGAGP